MMLLGMLCLAALFLDAWSNVSMPKADAARATVVVSAREVAFNVVVHHLDHDALGLVDVLNDAALDIDRHHLRLRDRIGRRLEIARRRSGGDQHVPLRLAPGELAGEALREEVDRPTACTSFVLAQGMGKLMEVGHDAELADQDDLVLSGEIMAASA